MGWDIYQFAFEKDNGGVRFICVAFDQDLTYPEKWKSRIQNPGSRLTLLGFFENCNVVQSFNSMIEVVTPQEFEVLWKVSCASHK